MQGRRMFALALAALAVPAAADVTYQSRRDFGPGAVGYLSITTNGTVGVLTAGDIVSFQLRLSGLRERARFYGAHPVIEAGQPGPLLLTGTSLVATPSRLFFDFDQAGGIFGVHGAADYLFLSTNNGAFQGPMEFLELDSEFSLNNWQSGTAMIAAVPEPASWAMLIAGFGLVGAAARRRQAALGRLKASLA